MKKLSYPFFVVSSIVLSKKTIFHKINEKIEIKVPGKLVHQLIKICDGTRSVNEIVKLLNNKWDENSVLGLINTLCLHDILADSNNFSDVLWKMVENPSHFPKSITNGDVDILVEKARERHKKDPSDITYRVSRSSLVTLINKRRSIRSFSGKLVKFQGIIDMLWSAYGEIHTYEDNVSAKYCSRSVPSAGALYPLMIHIALFRKIGELNSGIYKVYTGEPKEVGFSLVSNNMDQFTRSFIDPMVLDGACGVIVVSGSFNISGEKYGSRSMLYVTLEAGHVAQNVHLTALESKISTVEIGGFIEELLSEANKLPKYYHPLTTIVFGCEEKVVKENIVNSKVEVDWAIPVAGQYRLPFSMAFARISSNDNKDWSSGRALSPKLALTKAVSEAKEWAACGCISDRLTQAKLSDFVTAVDPRHIIRFHPAQYHLKMFPFKPFREEVEYLWVEGLNELEGSKVHVLADCVYYPYSPKTQRYAHATSSGVASHPDKQQAIKNGTLELVERDSFMIAYLTQLIFPTISIKTLPRNIQKRINNLCKNGFKIWVKDYSIDLAPVVFIFAQSEKLSFTTCASCSNFDTIEALDHALMEVESSVLCRLVNSPSKIIKPAQVRFPSDHGKLYEQKRFFHKADFLVSGQIVIEFKNMGQGVARSWDKLLDQFMLKGWSLITIPLHLTKESGGNNGLHIIRSIVPGMVPITFGYREIPAGIERISIVAKEINGCTISYQDMPKFPHPFT